MFKVRVLRTWAVPTFLKADQPNSIEMVLSDDEVVFFFLLLNIECCLFC